jgi:hypothetical protein
MSLGGEARLRYERFENASFGRGPQDANGYLFQRYLFHDDLHFGRRLRVFTQLQSGIENGRTGGPRAADQDQLEVHQAFADLNFGAETRKLTLRLGRQEIDFGSGRVISPGEWTLRRSLDGIRLNGRVGKWTLDAVGGHPTEVKPGVFDDSADHRQTLWTMGAVHSNPIDPAGTVSIQYVNFDRKQARFDSGAGREQRQTLNLVLAAARKRSDYTYNIFYQWGSLANLQIRAWGVATDTGWTVSSGPLQPRVGLRFNSTTGDRDPNDQVLGTFNSLFPLNAYSGPLGQLGPSNLSDIQPSLRFKPMRQLTVTTEWTFFWRQSTRDGLYGIALSPIVREAGTSRSRQAWDQPGLMVGWAVSRHTNLSLGMTALRARAFLRESLPPNQSVLYTTLQFLYRF